MLFLSRKVGESIIINDNITITISEINSKSVKMSFSYPKGTHVLRQEVYDRIQEENKLAATQADQIRSLLKESKEGKKKALVFFSPEDES